MTKSLTPSPPNSASRFAQSLVSSFSSEEIEKAVGPAIEEERAEAKPDKTLKEFTRIAWPVLEPGTRYIDNWHIDAICEHLEACSRQQIRNLIINIPPRCEKSLLVSVFWFAWTWTWKPESRWLYASYADQLATRDSLKCRRLITSKPYREQWGNLFKLTSDQNVKTRFENDRTGYRIATGVGGVGTGEGGDFVIVDDPHKVKEAESEVVREGVLNWWFETMSTRLNNPETGVRVVVMQRVHEGDLTGAVLARELNYEHLCLPMRYEADHPHATTKSRPTSIGFSDPREVEGELLWKERFKEPYVEGLETELGSFGAAGQLQQRPAPRKGGMFDRDWFDFVGAAPRQAARVIYVDKAGTQDGGAFTAIGRMAKDSDGVYYVERVVRGQWSALQRENVILQECHLARQEFGLNFQVWIEQEPGSGGKESAEATVRKLAGFDVHAESVTGDKEFRARPFAAQAEARNVKIVKGAWNTAYLDELCLFPRGTYKDQVDFSSGAFNKLCLMEVTVLAINPINRVVGVNFNRGGEL